MRGIAATDGPQLLMQQIVECMYASLEAVLMQVAHFDEWDKFRTFGESHCREEFQSYRSFALICSRAAFQPRRFVWDISNESLAESNKTNELRTTCIVDSWAVAATSCTRKISAKQHHIGSFWR